MMWLKSCKKGPLPAVVLFLLAVQGWGQSAADPVRALVEAPFAATAAQLQAASAAAPPTREDEAQILLNEVSYRIAANGSLRYEHRMIFRVDTKESLDNWAEISTNWDPWNEEAPQFHARVLRSGGQFVELDQKTITDAPVKGEDSETYSSERERRAPLPAMEVGAIGAGRVFARKDTVLFSGQSLSLPLFSRCPSCARASGGGNSSSDAVQGQNL